jgi:hypothetical protein
VLGAFFVLVVLFLPKGLVSLPATLDRLVRDRPGVVDDDAEVERR